MSPVLQPAYTVLEEIAHAVTHGVGALLSILCLVVLILSAVDQGAARHVVAGSIFGTALILLYLASTLYHGIPHIPTKRILRVIDHCAIYILIAGTYTPFALLGVQGTAGWSLLVVIWTLALLGIACKVSGRLRGHFWSVGFYLLMGWSALFAVHPLMQRLEWPGLALLLGGGALYSAGTLFYVEKRIPYHHAIWHCFVLGGSALHFFAVLYYLMPLSIMPLA